jgi:hypothetical protein
MNKKTAIMLLFIMELLIVLNIYNGELTPLSESIEYIMYYLVASVYISMIKTASTNSNKLIKIILVIGLLTNLWWYFRNPWEVDSDRHIVASKTPNNITDNTYIVNRPRHRTEFYCSHTLLAAILFVVMVVDEGKINI